MLVGLVLPILGFLLILRIQCVEALPQDPGWLATVELLRSHLLGYGAFFAIAVAGFLVAPRSPWVWVVRATVLASLGVLAFYEFAVYRMFMVSGTVVDWALTLYFLGNLRETLVVVQSEGHPVLVALGGLAALAVIGGALWLADRRQPDHARPRLVPRRYRHGATALAGAGVLVLLAAVPPATGSAPRSMGRAVTLNLVLGALNSRLELPEWAMELDGDYPTPGIAPRDPDARPPNLVVVALESTRARSVTPYAPDSPVTPFLDTLARDSLLVARPYAAFTHTTKTMVPLNCSIHPLPSMAVHESEAPGNVPVPCLAGLLGQQGYRSVFFRSATEHFEGWRQLVGNMGFDEFYPSESMDTEGFERANYFGYEDAILLQPSEDWLTENGDRPFFAFYMTGTPHHDYLAPTRYGRHDFHPDEQANLYLNSVWYLDHFVEELIAQYERLGLYEDTVFVLVGDHGEGLGEHRIRYHNDCPFEECVRVPLIVHQGDRFAGGARVENRVDQLDIAPTALDLLGFDLVPGAMVGRSFLGDPAPERTTFISCWYDRKCVASVRDGVKYMHFFDDVPDEMYELATDPDEQHNLSESRPQYAAERRAELLDWYFRTKGRYLAFLRERHAPEKTAANR